MRATISRSELFAFVRSLGANPNDTQSVELGVNEAKVTTLVRDEQGNPTGATQVTTIPYVGDGDAETVRMRHPNLDREIDVPATAVGHHAVAGWEVIGPYAQGGELPSGVTEVTASTPEPVFPRTPEDDKPKSGRRKSKESE